MEGYFIKSVTIYVVTFILISIPFLLPATKNIRQKIEKKLLYSMNLCVMLVAVFRGSFFFLLGARNAFKSTAWLRSVILICMDISYIFIFHFIFFWMLYVDYRLYRSRDQIFRRYRLLYIPVLVYTLARFFIVTIGIFCELKPQDIFGWSVSDIILAVFGFAYLIVPFILLLQYKKQKGRKSFFAVLPVIVCEILGKLGLYIFTLDFDVLGVAIGMGFLYIELIREQSLLDDLGFYNLKYLKKIMEKRSRKIDEIRGAVFFESIADTEKLGEVLHDELPTGDLIIRKDENSFALLTDTDCEDDLIFIADMVENAAEDTDNALSVTTGHVIREKNEEAEAFLNRTFLKQARQ